MSKDPFSEADDIDATVMRPSAFSRPTAPATAAPSAPPAPPAPAGGGAAATLRLPPLEENAGAALAAIGQNPLLAIAAPILALAARLRDLPQHRDVDALRERVIAELQRFDAAGTQAGLTTEQVRVGRYALCATVDDVVLNTPWGSQSVWANKSLVSTIQRETWGGERFFEFLEQMQQEPRRYLQELELLYACLSLGFEGKYRVLPRGHSDLARLRDVLFRVIRRERGDFERELSPQWRGIADRYRPLNAIIPLWVVGAVLAAVLMFVYMWFAFALGDRTDTVYARMAQLLPDRPVEIARLTPPPVAPPPPPAPNDTVDRITAFLKPEIDEGLLQVLGADRNGVVVRLLASLFPSAGNTVDPRFRPLIDRVAQALAAEKGSIHVVGHTDNVPIRSIRFPSNQELSVARADAVAALIVRTLGEPDRVSAEGRGDTEPIAPNTTPQGRQQNRRIEILLAPR